MKVLVVAAHPDDETLGCGGTIARLAQEGHEISVAVAGMRHLLQEFHQAMNLLGVKHRYYFDKPIEDQRYDAVDRLDLIDWIERVIRDVQAEVVYGHHLGDLNHDHQIIAHATLTACRPKPGCSVQEFYQFEVPSSTDWSFGYTFQPNVFMDISATLHLKLDAMELYQGEVHPYPHPRSRAALHAMADRWGSMVGLYHAEAFQLIRSIR